MRHLTKTLSTVFLTLLFLFPLSSRLQAETVTLSVADFPPFEFAKPEGGLRGFDVEVIEVAFERVQIKTDIKFLPWKRALEQTKRGQFAGIFSCSYNADRAIFLLFSDQISQSTHAYFVRRVFDGFEPSNVTEAKGLRVGSVLGWNQARIMEEAGASVVAYRSEELVFRNLLKGVIDYAYLAYESSGFNAMQLGISKDLRSIKSSVKKLYICFSKKWPGVEEIVQKFNEGLAAVRADGTYDAIHNKYR